MPISTRDDSGAGAAIARCGCWLIGVIISFALGSWSVNYLLLFFFAKSIPWFWAGIIGIFGGQIAFPVAVVVAILRMFSVL